MEFQQYFHELQTLCDDHSTNEETQEANYFDLISKFQKSMLDFSGANMLPPILSESDRQAMREHRRKAVIVEQKLFKARREKYSSILLQVMELTDKFQALGEAGNDVSKSFKPVERQSPFSNLIDEKFISSSALGRKVTNQSVDQHLEINTREENEAEGTKKTQENLKLIENDSVLHSLIFQKPKLHHSSSYQNHNTTKSFHSSLASNTPIDVKFDESVRSSRGGSLLEGSLESTNSTLKASLQSTPSEVINSQQDFHLNESLASTVLSMAFTDSSVASQHSVKDQPSKSAQRQLNMDQANETLYESYYHKVNPLTSTPDTHQEMQKPTTKKNIAPSSRVSISGRVYTKTDAEQDKALEKLEIMKRKLLQEKEKQMFILKQQELARIRKGKDKSQILHYSEGKFEMSSQGHFSSRPNSDMYSIPEQSFEGPSSLRQEDLNEVESASDKENNIYKEDFDNAYGNANHFDQRIHHRNELNDYKYDLEERLSGEIDSRPISVQSKQNIIGKDRRKSSLYVRQEFQKQFEIEISKENSGTNKFCILSAYSRGFLTRRLLNTEKVQTIVKTIKDTNEFLLDISKEGSISYQDKSLQERVQAQLFAAKSKLYDIFFKVPVHERMMYISHSRNAAKEREDRVNSKKTETKQLTRKLSAATMKAMQRRQSETSFSSDVKKTSPPGQLGKRSMETRALKPVQSTKSPQTTLRSQPKRRSLASPLARRSIGKKTTNSRPTTALGTRLPSNRKSIGRSSTEADKSIRQPRTSLDNRPLSSKRSKPTNETSNSKLPIKKHGNGSATYRVSNEELYNDKTKSRPPKANVTSHQPQKRQTESRPKTSLGVRRVTRSMAAQFNKQ